MKLEKRIQELGCELITNIRVLDDELQWLDALVNHAISDPQFRIQTLRFNDGFFIDI